MLNHRQRSAILKLHAKKVLMRRIARTLEISRPTVKRVIESSSSEMPRVFREEKAEAHRQAIPELHESCDGNVLRPSYALRQPPRTSSV